MSRMSVILAKKRQNNKMVEIWENREESSSRSSAEDEQVRDELSVNAKSTKS